MTTRDDLWEPLPGQEDRFATPSPIDDMEPFDWVSDQILAREVDEWQQRAAAAAEYQRMTTYDRERADASRLTAQQTAMRQRRVDLARWRGQVVEAAVRGIPLGGIIYSMAEMATTDYTAAEFGGEVGGEVDDSHITPGAFTPAPDWVRRAMVNDRGLARQAEGHARRLSRMIPSKWEPVRELPPENYQPQAPIGVPESITSQWGNLAAQSTSRYTERQRGEVQAGLDAGMSVYRDKDTGRIQYFDDTTYRMLDPADLRRDFIGGFDTDYVVDQTARILRGEPPAPRRFDDGYTDVGPTPQGFYQPEIYTQYAEMAPSRSREVTAPNYYSGDQWAYFAGASADEKFAVQERLAANGYLDPEDVSPGVWDYRTAVAMERLMTDANGNGVTWVEMLNEVERSGGRPQPPQRGGGTVRTISPFVAPEYIRPDYATMKQAVRGAFSNILGRDLDGNELKTLADMMDADYRSEYEAQVLAARKQYDRQVAAIRAGAQYAAEGGTVQGVSPIDRLNERLLERYAGEVERNQDIAERAANGQLVMQSMGVLESAVRR